MGKGIVDQLKKEYPIEDTWVSYELHPETPPAGVLLSERFKGHDLSSFHEQLRTRGTDVGVVFNSHTLLSNSRLSLMASEYARDMGKYDAFHDNIFHAYFTESMDIGKPDVITTVAAKSGLDAKEAIAAVNDGRYASRLDEARREGELIGLTGIPLFIINKQYKIVGAQPIEAFRNLLEKIK
ncbi:MAG: DsbA family oxidoreductase [Smithellaceae bacterium]